MTPTESDRLLRALANRELTGGETERLAELCADRPELAAEVSAFKELHSLLEGERHLEKQVLAPGEPAEESGETWQRLQRAAAVAEEELRGRLRFGPRLAAVPQRRRRLWWLLPAAAALVAAFWWSGWSGGGGPPELTPGQPVDQRLGTVPRIVMNPVLSADSRSLSWAPVPGAVSYQALVLDTEGGTVLARQPEQAGSTTWELTSEQYRELRARRGLRLRVVARDGAGIALASTGDLELVLR